MTAPLCIQMCGYFRGELSALMKEPEFADLVSGFFPAACGRPPLSQAAIQTATPVENSATSSLLIGSVCLANLTADSKNNTTSIMLERHEQCFYPFADKAWVDSLMAQGAYLITPGWLQHWRHWVDELGFADNAALRDYFQVFAKRLVLLDTRVLKDAGQKLNELADCLGLPCESIPIGLEHFRLYMSKLLLQWQGEREADASEARLSRLQAELANYAMAMDLVRTLARSLHESRAIDQMRDVFEMLFAAQQVRYQPDTQPSAKRFDTFEDGFRIAIHTDKNHYGSIQVNGLAFPQYRDRYLNVALVLTGVCALAIENARAYQAVLDAEASLRHTNKRLEQTIDDLHRTQKQLVEAEKMASLGTLVAGVAHEINTPVGVGLTAATTLEERSKRLAERFQSRSMKQSDLRTYLDVTQDALGLISGNLQRIGDLVSSFKQVAIDRYTDRRRSFHLRAYLLDIVQSLGKSLSPERVSVEVVCDPEYAVESYPGVVAQILSNLLQNSLEHGFGQQGGGRIEIRVEPGDTAWTLHYRDDGRGISPDNLPKLFDPFFTTDLQGHTGLGMHVLYNLVVQKLEGRVVCESRPGQGVHFTLEFPYARQEIAA